MQAISFGEKFLKHTTGLRYLGIHFHGMPTYKSQVESTKHGCKKGLSALKAIAAKGIEQSSAPVYQSVILSVIDYDLGLTIPSESNPLQPDKVQNKSTGHSRNNKRHAQ